MNYFTCFNRWLKSRLPANILLGLLIAVVISLGCNQAARSLTYYLYAGGGQKYALLNVSMSSGYVTGTARSVKNIVGKNHRPLSHYFTTALQTLNAHVHSPNLFIVGHSCFISLSWRQLHHTYFLQDLSPPLSS